MAAHTVVVVVASNYRQAVMVTEQLELPPPDSRTRPDVEEIVLFAGPHDGPKLMGLLPDRVIWATPILCDGLDRERLRAVRLLSESRAARKGVAAQVVRT